MFPRLHRVEVFSVLLVICVAIWSRGCSPSAHLATNIPDSLPAAGEGIAGTRAHIESAEKINVAAKDVAGKEAKPLLDLQSKEHGAAIGTLDKTGRAIAQANQQRESLAAENLKQALTLTKITSGLWYRIGLWLTRGAFLLIGLAGLHVALGIAALFVTGPAGAVVARLGVYVNPFAWFQSARDNYYFRTCGQHSASPPAVGEGGA